MKLKALLLFLGILMSQLLVNAQKKEFKFGKVTAEDFQVKAPGEDSAAAAVKIFDVGNCYFDIGPSGFIYVFERHFRYKILNKKGYDYANYKIGLYSGSSGSKETLESMQAATYNMDNGQMIATKIGKDAKFTEEFNKQYKFKKFTLPNVKEGSIIEFKYTIKSDFIFNLRGWSFQDEVPILYTEYNVTIPDYLVYKSNFSGILQVSSNRNETSNSIIGGKRTNAMETKYFLSDVPALKDEAYITTLDDYRPALEFELMATRFPNEMYQDYTGTWPKILSGLISDGNFGVFVNKSSYAKATLPTIVKAEKDSLAVLNLIFNHVKNNIKWNGDYSKYSSETNPKVIFDKKAGNSADINLCLIGFLKAAKFNVSPVLVSTRENGMHPGLPTVSKFNNVIASVTINNKDVLLDATEKDMRVGMVGYENLNHQFFLVDLATSTGKWFQSEPSFKDERTFIYNLILDKDNKLKGTLSQSFDGYAGLNFRNKYRTTNNEQEFLNEYKKNKPGLSISNYKVMNLDSADKMVTETMSVDIEDNVEEAGNLVYFMPLLFERTKENIFKHEKREFPVDFGHQRKENYRIVIRFPEDYEIDKLPASAVYKIPDEKGTFSILYTAEGQQLMVRSTIDIKSTVYSPDEYFHLKELFKNIVLKQAEQIVFKKKV